MKLAGIFTASIRRKILVSNIVVIILVLMLAVATYAQLELVRSLSRQVPPSSSRVTALQNYVMVMWDLENNLDRYFLIGGPRIKNEIREDISRMHSILESASVNINPEVNPIPRWSQSIPLWKPEKFHVCWPLSISQGDAPQKSKTICSALREKAVPLCLRIM